MKIEVSNKARIIGASAMVNGALRGQLSMLNPKWVENDRMGRYNGNTPRMLSFADSNQFGETLIPRGHLYDAARFLSQFGEVEYVDRRRELSPIDVSFKGALRERQAAAVKVMLARDHGTLCAPTGAGKTVMGLAIIAERAQPSLVLVHTKELLNQWKDRAETFLDLPGGVGLVGGGNKFKPGKPLYVGLVQTVRKRIAEIDQHVGHVVVDECHRTPSATFSDIVTGFSAKYLTGLTATPYRRDRMTNAIFWVIGPCWHKIDELQLESEGDIIPAKIIPRHTTWTTVFDPKKQYGKALKDMTKDVDRNTMIARDVRDDFFLNNGIILVLTDRVDHCRVLAEMIRKAGVVRTAVLTGQTSAKARAGIVTAINNLELDAIVATGQLIGEGFDCKNLDAIFLTTPVKFHGRLTQYIGRVLRPGSGKEYARIYDYVDDKLDVFRKSWASRRRTYLNRGWAV